MTYLEMRIKLRGGGLSDPDELAVRHKLQELIEERGIGEVIGGGSGLGEMDIGVEVTDSEEGKRRLRELADEFLLGERASVEEA